MGATCKGFCDQIKLIHLNKRPKKLPYLTHSHCRGCELWLKRIDYGIRCPCCHTILAILPRENGKKKIYRKIFHGEMKLET